MRHTSVGEEGAVAVVAALTLTVLLLVAAVVVDLAALRADRVAGQSVADMSVAAAAQVYDPAEIGSPRHACLEAVAFASANVGETLTAVGPGCDAFPSDVACDAGFVREARYTAGAVELRVVNPVLDDDVIMQDLLHGPDRDGAPCDRVGVRVVRERDFVLAGAVGAGDSGRTDRGAVSVVLPAAGDDAFASLIVLQREGCRTLRTGGNPDLIVASAIDGDGTEYPGTITVDTRPPSGGCQTNRKLINSTGTALIQAEGRIIAHALASGDPGNLHTFNPAAVGTSPATPGRLYPRPEPGPMVTRAPIDHRFNCRPAYDSTSEPWSPIWSSLPASVLQPIDGCDEGLPPFLSELHAWLATGSGVPDGDWYDVVAERGNVCRKQHPPEIVTGEPRVFIDCPGGFEPNDVIIEGAEHVVVNGDVSLGNQENLTITGALPRGTVLVLRNGDLDRTGGNLRLRNVFTYAVQGHLNLRGTSGDLLWQAPPARYDDTSPYAEDPAACRTGDGRPSGACFGPLAWWGNTSSDNFIAGSASGGIIGTVFVPNSLMELRGGQSVDLTPCSGSVEWSTIASSTGTLNLEGVQFFAASYDLGGSSGLRLCPSPQTTVPTFGGRTFALIR